MCQGRCSSLCQLTRPQSPAPHLAALTQMGQKSESASNHKAKAKGGEQGQPCCSCSQVDWVGTCLGLSTFFTYCS
ncbi:hypothetical protein JZ751_015182, partial [Albula glossodonta]